MVAFIEHKIVFYAGWLGHYVGDGSQPLHTTIHYNGWVDDHSKASRDTQHRPPLPLFTQT